jgi:flavin-dependent thymidylate synthase
MSVFINFVDQCSVDWITREMSDSMMLKIPYYSEVFKIYLGYRQCYSKVPGAEKTMSEEEANQLKELYKRHIVESVLGENKFGKTVDKLYFDSTDFYYAKGSEEDPTLSDKNAAAEKMYKYFTSLEGEEEFLGFLRYCKFIKGHVNHQSPIEHGTITFRLTNVSRSLTHQLVRHRLASYSQLSQRYVGEKGDLTVVIPHKILVNHPAQEIFEAHMQRVAEDIAKLRDAGIKNEDIRAIYPNAITTQIIVTMNFREAMHFISLRMSPHAQDEIRDVAWKVWNELNTFVPFVFSDIKIE